MHDSNRDPQEGTGDRDCPRIGIDRSGACHYHDELQDRILVTQDGDVTHVEDLDGRPVDHWIEFVRDQRGWASCFWSADAIASVAVAVTD